MVNITKDQYLNDIEEHDITDCPRCGSNQTLCIKGRTYRCLENYCSHIFTIEGGREE